MDIPVISESLFFMPAERVSACFLCLVYSGAIYISRSWSWIENKEQDSLKNEFLVWGFIFVNKKIHGVISTAIQM